MCARSERRCWQLDVERDSDAAGPAKTEEIAMTFNRFAMMASFLGACGVALLSQGGALTIASHDGAALSGPSAAAHAELEQLESAVPAGRRAHATPRDGRPAPRRDP